MCHKERRDLFTKGSIYWCFVNNQIPHSDACFIYLTWFLPRCLYGPWGFRAPAVEVDYQIQLPRASHTLCQEHLMPGKGEFLCKQIGVVVLIFTARVISVHFIMRTKRA